LFAPGRYLGWKLGVDQGVEFVEDGDDAVLDGERGDGDFDLSNLT
jgi:hypothetical protein